MLLYDIILNVATALLTTEQPTYSLKIGLIVGIACYASLLFFFYGRQKSYWDVYATKKLMNYIRAVVFIEILCLLFLLYYTIGFGNPLTNVTNSAWQLKKGLSWIYGYPRPVSGIILVGFGMAADVHIFVRVFCILGLLLQIVSDVISATQVYLYYGTVKDGNASGGNYTDSEMYQYYMRDVVSVGICTTILLLMLHLTIMLEISLHQYFPYSMIVGGDMDRCEVMRQQRSIKKSRSMIKEDV
jgi:hypothetical protein